MNKKETIHKITLAARRDARRRKDPRYLQVMGLLTANGFLHTNQPIPFLPKARVRIEDALWAGNEVEPRILEVLPAAVLRMSQHFDFDPTKHIELAPVLEHLRKGLAHGPNLGVIPFEKIRVLLDFQMKDKRVKAFNQKKITKTFRLKPTTIRRIQELAKKSNCSETEIVEKLFLQKS